MPGPAPTPTKILNARGSWRAKIRDGEPQLPVSRPSCPACLPAEAKSEWRRLVPQLIRMGVLSKVDRSMLTAYCEAWAELVEAVEFLEEHGKTFTTEKGYVVVHPYVAIRNSAVDRMKAIAARFGFTPADRARLRATPQEEPKKDGKARFFRAG